MKQAARIFGWNDRVSSAIFALCLADLVLLGLTLWALFGYRAAVADRGDARQLLIALESTLLALTDAESAERGYIITGDARYLEPYRTGVARVETALAGVSAYVDGGVEQKLFEDLVPIVAARKVELARTIELRDPSAIAAGPGEALMEDIRENIGALRTRSVARSIESERRDEQLGNVLSAGAITVAMLTIGMVGALTFTLRRRVAAEAERRTGLAKDEFVGFVSHELRSPISVITGNVRLLKNSQVPLGPEEGESLDEITHAAERLEATVATLLSLAKAESGGNLEVEPVLIQRVAEGAARHHHTRFPERDVRLETPPSLPLVLADRHAIEQVILNLLQNAEKYGDRSAPIRIEILPQVETMELHVINEGPRLERDQFKHVFEAFFQLPGKKSGGVGLGLTVCQRLVRAQGGTMVAEPRADGGACFSFRLRLAPGEAVDM